MEKDKKSSDMPEPKPAAKKAVKKSSAKKVTVKKPVSSEIAAAAAAAVTSSQPAVPPVHKAEPSAGQLHDEIRRRAFELYRERGGQHGSHEADWHRAESEVRSRYKA
jgi:hypothetical protein